MQSISKTLFILLLISQIFLFPYKPFYAAEKDEKIGKIEEEIKEERIEGAEGTKGIEGKKSKNIEEIEGVEEIDEIEKIEKTQEDKIKIAILDLQSVNLDTSTSIIVSDSLRAEMIKTEYFNVAKKQEMDKISEELDYKMSECTKMECAVEIGYLLSAHKVLMGTINKIENVFIINVKIVNVEKEVIEFEESIEVESESELDADCKMFAQKLAAMIKEGKVEEEKAEEIKVKPIKEERYPVETKGYISLSIGIIDLIPLNESFKKYVDSNLGIYMKLGFNIYNFGMDLFYVGGSQDELKDNIRIYTHEFSKWDISQFGLQLYKNFPILKSLSILGGVGGQLETIDISFIKAGEGYGDKEKEEAMSFANNNLFLMIGAILNIPVGKKYGLLINFEYKYAFLNKWVDWSILAFSVGFAY